MCKEKEMSSFVEHSNVSGWFWTGVSRVQHIWFKEVQLGASVKAGHNWGTTVTPQEEEKEKKTAWEWEEMHP